MKKFLSLLLSSALILPVLTACGSDDAPIGGRDPVIGGDWRTLRGYSSESFPFLSDRRVLLSMFEDEDGYGYAFYDSEEGYHMGGIRVSVPGYPVENFEGSGGNWYVEVLDLNGDGAVEYGMPMKDGTVLWYEYVAGDCYFQYFGPGTKDGPAEPFPSRVGAGRSRTFALGDLNVCFTYYQDSLTGCGGYFIHDADQPDGYEGSLIVDPQDGGWTFRDLDRSGEDRILVEDRDADGLPEIGLPLTNGAVLWYRLCLDEDAEDYGNYLYEEADTTRLDPEWKPQLPEDPAAWLLDTLGPRAEGMVPDEYEPVEIHGVTCSVFALCPETDDLSPRSYDESFYAVAPGGEVFRYHSLTEEFLPFRV